MRTIFLKVLIVILVFIGSFCFAQQQEINISVAPETFDLKVKRGDELSEKIKIYNGSSVALPMEVIATNFSAQEESGTITFYEEPASVTGKDDISYNPRKWIEIENPNFILDPGEVEEVGLKINIPEGAEPGGHYAVILFEPKLPSFYFKEGAVKTIPKVGVLILFSVEVEGIKKVEEPLTIAEFDIPESYHLNNLENFFSLFNKALASKKEELSIVETSHLPFTLSIKNNDIYHAKIKGKLTIAKSNGKIVGETEIKETTILPHRTRKFPVGFTPNLPEKINKFLPASISSFISRNFLFGKYQAHLLLTTGDDKIVKDIEFWVFPWKVWLSTGILFCVLLVAVLKYKKRIKSAFLVLFKKTINS